MKYPVKSVSPSMYHLLQHFILGESNKVQVFYRLLKDSEMFYCGRVTKRNSFTAFFRCQGKIHCGIIVVYYIISGVPVAVIKALKFLTTVNKFGLNIPLLS